MVESTAPVWLDWFLNDFRGFAVRIAVQSSIFSGLRLSQRAVSGLCAI